MAKTEKDTTPEVATVTETATAAPAATSLNITYNEYKVHASPFFIDVPGGGSKVAGYKCTRDEKPQRTNIQLDAYRAQVRNSKMHNMLVVLLEPTDTRTEFIVDFINPEKSTF
jgi:hypothetical protein